ncbi:unnamed protein product [Closterium sp. NIES-53]
MFRKPSDIRGKQRLSGADRKKLRRNIRDKFPGTTDEQLEAILPAKADVVVTRLLNRVLVYGLENGLPMLFVCFGRGTEIYPTGNPTDTRRNPSLPTFPFPPFPLLSTVLPPNPRAGVMNSILRVYVFPPSSTPIHLEKSFTQP